MVLKLKTLSPSAQGENLQLKVAFVLKQPTLSSPAMKFSFFILLSFCNSVAEFFKMLWHMLFYQLCYQNKPEH